MDIDLNADLGEGAGFDAELMPLVTSANVCCGRHAGNEATTRATLELAKRHGVRVGAHPGYPDREHFGRQDMELPGQSLFRLIRDQLNDLCRMAGEVGTEVRYVKPHGALYNQAGRDDAVAEILAAACVNVVPLIVGLPNSCLQRVAIYLEIRFVPEGFADRRYRPDGSLVPRTEPDAMIHDPVEAVEQVEWLVREKGVRTVCVHGDKPDAVAFARAVRDSLLARGHTLTPFA